MQWDQQVKIQHFKIPSIHGEKIEFLEVQVLVRRQWLQVDLLRHRFEQIRGEVFVNPLQCVELFDLSPRMEETVVF